MKPLAYRNPVTVAAALVLLLGSSAVSAGAPSDVSDLVGARGAGGEMELGRRGYEYVTMTHGTQYWWNAKRKACIGIRVAEGRYQSVSAAKPSHCNQGGGPSSGSEVSSAAQSACMVAVNGNYGGKVDDIKLVRSEFSQANSEVILDAVGVRGGPTTERWKCLVSNDGTVQELSVVGN